MSHGHFDTFSQKGGKCHMVILTNNHKKEENISRTFCQVFTKKEGNVTKPLTTFQKYLEAWEEKLNGEKSDW